MIGECTKCGGNLRIDILPTFRVDSLGIEGVNVVDAVERAICETCKEIAYTTIPHLPELIAATAVWRCMIPTKLNAKEIAFLRDALSLKQRELAQEIGVTPETVSRWLNQEIPIADGNEKNLRQSVGARLKEQAPGVRFDATVVARMRISGPRSQDVIQMSFCRVLVAPEQESWNPRRMAVNS